jgi:peptidoglycan hydrolase CwlO-like protein
MALESVISAVISQTIKRANTILATINHLKYQYKAQAQQSIMNPDDQKIQDRLQKLQKRIDERNEKLQEQLRRIDELKEERSETKSLAIRD